MKVLITGGSGLLALNWACAIRARHDVVLATHRRRISAVRHVTAALALDDRGALCAALERLAPDIIVHTAGLTSVDACEQDPELAQHVNAELSRNVAEAAVAANARLIHISTDHLFAGTHALYTENDAPEPLNAYARSKLSAEEEVTAACPARSSCAPTSSAGVTATGSRSATGSTTRCTPAGR